MPGGEAPAILRVQRGKRGNMHASGTAAVGGGVRVDLGQEARAQQVAHAVDAVEHGTSVEVSGPAGSGRTAFLHAVGSRLEGHGWTVLAVAGIPALLARPLGALGALGAISAATAHSGDVHAAADELADRLPPRRAVVVVDDGDDLDDDSWGALCALRSGRRTPVLWARRIGAEDAVSSGGPWSASTGSLEAAALPDAGARPTGSASGLHGVTSIQLGGLRYDEFVTLLNTRLEHPVDSSTAARVFAQTAGRPGLALAAVETALRERRLLADGQGVSGVGSLWSPALARPLRALVEPLDRRQHDVVALLALLGETGIETAEALATDDELDGLEARALIRIRESGGEMLVSVDPPLLADYLRGTTRPARRRRLLQRARDAASVATTDAPDPGYAESAAQLVQSLHDAEKARVAQAARAWETGRTMEAAIAYVRTLARSAGAVDPRIDDVLHASSTLPVGDEGRAAWAIENAYNTAYRHGEPERAVADLRSAADGFGRHAGLVHARAAEIEIELVGEPDLSLLLDPDDVGLRPEVAAATHRALGYGLLVGGRVGEAVHHLNAARAVGAEDPVVDHLEAFARLVRGDVGAATGEARARFLESRAALDPVGMRLHGSILTFGSLASGVHGDLDDVLAEVAMLGGPAGPPPVGPSTALSNTVMALVVASRTGRRAGAGHHDADLQASILPDGPLPGMQRAWAQAQAELCAGETGTAARTMGEAADALWKRGARLAAAFAYLIAIEIEPTRERYDGAAARIRSVDGELIGSSLRYAAGLVEGSPETLVALGDAFIGERRYSLALAAYARAADLHTDAQRPADAAAARARGDELERTVGIGRFDPHRFISTRAELTARELEVARLASTGLTNRQIAEELVLSTRTVESHLHRVMRKLRVERRSQLKERMEGAPDEWR